MEPTDRKYSKEHEWALVEGDIATIGITAFAQDQLGDIVYVDLPRIGARIQQFEKFGEIESVKAVSDLYSPISGEVIEVNRALLDQPELVNQGPYAEGWIAKVRLANPAELDGLLDASAYEAETSAER